MRVAHLMKAALFPLATACAPKVVTAPVSFSFADSVEVVSADHVAARALVVPPLWAQERSLQEQASVPEGPSFVADKGGVPSRRWGVLPQLLGAVAMIAVMSGLFLSDLQRFVPKRPEDADELAFVGDDDYAELSRQIEVVKNAVSGSVITLIDLMRKRALCSLRAQRCHEAYHDFAVMDRLFDHLSWGAVGRQDSPRLCRKLQMFLDRIPLPDESKELLHIQAEIDASLIAAVFLSKSPSRNHPEFLPPADVIGELASIVVFYRNLLTEADWRVLRRFEPALLQVSLMNYMLLDAGEGPFVDASVN